jgi:hypothetical protein
MSQVAGLDACEQFDSRDCCCENITGQAWMMKQKPCCGAHDEKLHRPTDRAALSVPNRAFAYLLFKYVGNW